MKLNILAMLFLMGTFDSLAQLQPTTPISQKSSADGKCFPSGTSLIAGSISFDGQYVVLSNMAGKAKFFEVRTMGPVAVNQQNPDNKSAFYKKYFTPEPAPIVNYTFEKTETSKDKNGHVYGSFKIKNKKGETVQSSDNCFLGKVFFEPRTGTLFTNQYRKSKFYITMYVVGKSPKEFADDNYLIGSYNDVSPDGRYFVSGRGVIFDLEKGRMKAFQDGHIMADEVQVAFLASSDKFIVPKDKEGIITYSCAEGKRVSSIPIPADLPRVEGFKVVPAPNGEDFLYYMNFRNERAAGLAYWVHNGVGVSFCDPLWDQEQTDNNGKLITEASKRAKLQAAQAAEAERKRAIDNAQVQRNMAIQDEYRRQHPTPDKSASQPANTVAKCAKCNGTGSVMQRNISYYKSTSEYIGGKGSGSTLYRETKTPVYSQYPTPTICGECYGTGKAKR